MRPKQSGAGYNMVVVKSPQCDVDALTRRIQTHIPSAELQVQFSLLLNAFCVFVLFNLYIVISVSLFPICFTSSLTALRRTSKP